MTAFLFGQPRVHEIGQEAGHIKKDFRYSRVRHSRFRNDPATPHNRGGFAQPRWGTIRSLGEAVPEGPDTDLEGSTSTRCWSEQENQRKVVRQRLGALLRWICLRVQTPSGRRIPKTQPQSARVEGLPRQDAWALPVTRSSGRSWPRRGCRTTSHSSHIKWCPAAGWAGPSRCPEPERRNVKSPVRHPMETP